MHTDTHTSLWSIEFLELKLLPTILDGAKTNKAKKIKAIYLYGRLINSQ